MSGEIEAFGELATGGLIARALGARSRVSRHAAHDDHELRDCQNCGAALAGPFCHACGQSGHVHRTLGHVIEEFAHGVFHVESKGWRTLPMLVANPGRLTREYIHGRRARYIAPLAMFLFMVFLTFASFGLAGDTLVNMGGASSPPRRAPIWRRPGRIWPKLRPIPIRLPPPCGRARWASSWRARRSRGRTRYTRARYPPPSATVIRPHRVRSGRE